VSSTNSPGRDKDATNSEVGAVTPTTPLRLEVAARLAFPDGSMKLAGLRREIARGRLAYEMICGRHYTTLADIEDMRKLCRVAVKVHTSTVVGHTSEMSKELLSARLAQHRLIRKSKSKPGKR
jgi:hypothetical protein